MFSFSFFFFHSELHASKIVEENDKKAKERQKTVITGDLNPLTLALQDIDSFSFLCQIDKNKRFVPLFCFLSSTFICKLIHIFRSYFFMKRFKRESLSQTKVM